jgi:hypothetical protein
MAGEVENLKIFNFKLRFFQTIENDFQKSRSSNVPIRNLKGGRREKRDKLRQRSLTIEEDSVQLTSLYQLFKIKFLLKKLHL